MGQGSIVGGKQCSSERIVGCKSIESLIEEILVLLTVTIVLTVFPPQLLYSPPSFVPFLAASFGSKTDQLTDHYLDVRLVELE